MRNPACLVLPGAGTRGGAVVGAVEVITQYRSIEAYAGTSFGGLAALFLASGRTPGELSAMTTKMLMRTDLLDMGIPLINTGPGLYRGTKIEELLQSDEVFGKMKMGDLKHPCRVGVSSLWTGRVGLVDNVWHKDVLVWRAARCTMGIQGFFDPARLREDNARTYGDGGAGLNVPAGAWDDRTAQTIVVRFTEQQPVHTLGNLLTAMNGNSDIPTVKSVRTYPEMLAATFNVLMGAAASSYPSTKRDTKEIVITSDADGLKFGLSREECERRRMHGIASAKAQVRVLIE